MTNITINLLIIDDNKKTIKEINGYINQFNIEIQAFFETDLNTVNDIIKNHNIDYLFVSDNIVKQNYLKSIVAQLKLTNNNDCIIVFHDISENAFSTFKNANFLLPDEFSFDFFKKLIGYSIVSRNLPTKDDNINDIYQHDFITTHDALTMLPNRAFLLKKADAILKAAVEHHQEIVIFFIDLDGFKGINDTAGHATGDLVLQEVARRLVKNTRATDLVSRHGGDEFVVLFSHIRSRQDIEVVADKILSILSEPFYINQENWPISASIGVATYPDDGATAEKLISNADAAMYMAKQAGKATVRYFNKELNDQITKKAKILNEIREAIINNDFEILLQPQHELKTGDLIGAEVFIRWHHPKRGVIMPSDFLPDIANTGYINALGNLILKKALAVNYEINNSEYNNLRIAINVEPRQLINDDLINHLIGLKSFGVNVKRLAVEITEDCFKINFEIIKQKLYKLRELGIKIYLDNFGLGNSSVTQLSDLPIDIVKIDNKLLCDIQNSANMKKGIISLSHSFNIKTMAKRIDDVNQLQNLLDIGCDYGQGYCYSHPLAIKEFNRYIKEHTFRKHGAL